MKSSGLFGVANGATQLVLTVPAGKKYELLEVACWYNSAGGGINAVPVVGDGVSVVLPHWTTSPAGLGFMHEKYGPLLLRAGWTYSLAIANTTGGATAEVTYMDVDL
jgi:hypothetical protein